MFGYSTLNLDSFLGKIIFVKSKKKKKKLSKAQINAADIFEGELSMISTFLRKPPKNGKTMTCHIFENCISMLCPYHFQLCLTLSAELLPWRRRPLSVRPSVVRKLKFLGNRCIGLGQILSVTPSPPYLQTIFLFCFFHSFQF